VGQKGYFARTFHALAIPQFRTLWFGTLFSFLGMQMQVIARGYLAYHLTGKNSALGAVMLAFGVPQLLLSLWGGVLADRLPKRTVLLVSQGIIAANSAWLATMIELDMVKFWMLIVAGLVQGAGFAFVGPARQAFIGDLVGREAMGNAVVLQQLSMNSTRVIGPSLAGIFIVLPFVGVGGVYYMTTLGFIAASITMLRLPPGTPHADAKQSSPLADMKAGLLYVKSRPQIFVLIMTSFCVVMVGFAYQSFLPSLAKSEFGRGAGGLGALSSVGAIGAVCTTVFVAAVSGKRAWALQSLSGLLFGISLIGLGLAPSFALGLGAMVFVGALASAFQSLNNSLTMTVTDPKFHGRVQSISMMSWSLFGLAALPIGILADRIGLRETLALQGAFCILAVIIIEAIARARNVAADRAPRALIRDSQPGRGVAVPGGR
jgi:MFS family permease